MLFSNSIVNEVRQMRRHEKSPENQGDSGKKSQSISSQVVFGQIEEFACQITQNDQNFVIEFKVKKQIPKTNCRFVKFIFSL